MLIVAYVLPVFLMSCQTINSPIPQIDYGQLIRCPATSTHTTSTHTTAPQTLPTDTTHKHYPQTLLLLNSELQMLPAVSLCCVVCRVIDESEKTFREEGTGTANFLHVGSLSQFFALTVCLMTGTASLPQ